MKPPLAIGQTFTCDGCGSRRAYKGHCIESVHPLSAVGFLHFCCRRCYFVCLARGGELLGGRRILVLDGSTPTEILAELFRRRHIDLDPSAPPSRLIEAISQIEFSRPA